jgi:hypothetical protein
MNALVHKYSLEAKLFWLDNKLLKILVLIFICAAINLIRFHYNKFFYF